MDWLSKLDWGSVPAWLGAGSLILAFVVFARDRGNAERTQVDLVGAWTTVVWAMSEPHQTPRVEEGMVTAHLRNASQLPVRVRQLAYRIETSWWVPDPTAQGPSDPNSWTATPGTESQMFFIDNVRLPPQETLRPECQVNVAHMAPDVASHLVFTDGILAHIEWILIVDNAGRRWVVRPERGGRAKRQRWRRRSRRNEYMPQDW